MMMSRRGGEELDIERTMADALDGIATDGLIVQPHPRMGDAQPDYLVATPDAAYIIEIKTGLGASRLGSIAQLATYRDELRNAFDQDVTPILVAVGPHAADLAEAGQDFGIEVIAGEEAGAVAESLQTRLRPEYGQAAPPSDDRHAT
jgi:hypothetical protein